MKALVSDGTGGVRLGEADEPTRGPGDALVAVAASSVNRVDARRLSSGAAEPGVAGGLDVAGTVLEQAADGSGPPTGSRVLAYCGGGGWAERVAVPTTQLAVAPDELALPVAASLPTAGLTALRALALGGSLLGARVLVTGATGGVGAFATQLALAAGARVTAAVRTPERTGDARALGAAQVVVGTELGGPYDVIVDGVGGAVLGAVMAAVDADGVVVQLGRSASDGPDAGHATIEPSWFGTAPGARLVAMVLHHELSRRGTGTRDLELLADLALRGVVSVPIDGTVPWEQTSELLRQLRTGGAIGKLVLLVDAAGA